MAAVTPEFDEPVAPARHRDALHGIAAGPRNAGLALAVLGLVAAVLRGTALPRLPELVPVALIVTALGLMLIGIIRRARYHAARLKRPRS